MTPKQVFTLKTVSADELHLRQIIIFCAQRDEGDDEPAPKTIGVVGLTDCFIGGRKVSEEKFSQEFMADKLEGELGEAVETLIETIDRLAKEKLGQ